MSNRFPDPAAGSKPVPRDEQKTPEGICESVVDVCRPPRDKALMKLIKNSIENGKQQGGAQSMHPQPWKPILMKESPMTEEAKNTIDSRMSDLVGANDESN